MGSVNNDVISLIRSIVIKNKINHFNRQYNNTYHLKIYNTFECYVDSKEMCAFNYRTNNGYYYIHKLQKTKNFFISNIPLPDNYKL